MEMPSKTKQDRPGTTLCLVPAPAPRYAWCLPWHPTHALLHSAHVRSRGQIATWARSTSILWPVGGGLKTFVDHRWWGFEDEYCRVSPRLPLMCDFGRLCLEHNEISSGSVRLHP